MTEEQEEGKSPRKKKESALDKPLLGLVLTPTRELAIQVKQHIDNAAKYTGITVRLEISHW